MNQHFKLLAPFAFALLLTLSGRVAQACDLKSCPHHGQQAKSCSCPCGEAKEGRKAGKADHACSKGMCKKSMCTDKGCCMMHGSPKPADSGAVPGASPSQAKDERTSG